MLHPFLPPGLSRSRRDGAGENPRRVPCVASGQPAWPR